MPVNLARVFVDTSSNMGQSISIGHTSNSYSILDEENLTSPTGNNNNEEFRDNIEVEIEKVESKYRL
jgi:hypothetical protein